MFHESIHVLGAGSIGILWAASIRSKFPAYPITLLLRDHDKNRKRVEAAGAAITSRNNSSSEGNDCRQFELGITWNNRQALPEQNQRIFLPVQFIGDDSEQLRHNRQQHEYEQEQIQTLIVATKAHQAKQAVESVLDRLVLPTKNCDGDGQCASSSDNSLPSFSSTRIILLCNGALSVREELSKILPLNPANGDNSNTISLTLATTTHGAYVSGPNELVHAGAGTTFLEEPSSLSSSPSLEHNSIVQVWNQAGLNCTSLSSREMNSMLWKKLAANCVINPLTSIFRCTNGELLMEPSFPQLREEILMEVAHVAAVAIETENRQRQEQEPSLSVEATSNNNYNSSSGIPSIDEMLKFVTQTILATRDNKSSMYQDILKGQQHQRTEIDHLNGYVVRKGKEMSFDCPANIDLCSRIAELTAVQNTASASTNR